MSSPPKIAILFAAYNGMRWIDEQINTILGQQGIEVDIYISVDLSIDGTYEWCQELESRESCITVLMYGECFGGASKNFFRLIREVDLSEYDFVSFADQDDIWLPSKLSRAVEVLHRDGADAYSSNVMAFWEDGRELLLEKSQPQKTLDYYFESAGPGCTYVMKSASLQKFKVFLLDNWVQVNEIELHDWMIYAYFRAQGMGWVIDTKPLMRYRIHGSNQIGANSGGKAYLRRISMIKNGWYRKQVEGIRILVSPKRQFGRWFLVRNFWQLRRKGREAFVFLLMIVLGVY